MRMMALMLTVVFCSTAAMAQDKPPPPAGKPAAQAKQAKPKAAPAKPQSIAAKLQACLEIDDATKNRLDCFDAIFAPQPKAKTPPGKRVANCR